MNNNLSRFADSKVYFQCPICTKSMDIQGNSLICRHGHCFDISRYGYVNLLLKIIAQNQLQQAVFWQPAPNFWSMACMMLCWRKSYSLFLYAIYKKHFRCWLRRGFLCKADTAKNRTKHLCLWLVKGGNTDCIKKRQAQSSEVVCYCLTKIPLKDGSMDCILDIFSPAHYKEFQRLLSPNGYVVKVIPTKNHLREIRTKVQAHLKNPDYSNESVVEYFEKYLKTISRETVSATVQLSSEQRMSFIEMTPLLFCVEKDCVDWRTLTHLTIEADVLIGMY